MNPKQLASNSVSFFKNHSTITTIIVVLVLMLGAFASGRYTVPTKIVTKTEVQTVHDVVTQIKTEYVEKKVYITAQKNDVTTTTDTIKKPDGTVETKVTEVDKTQTDSTDTEQASSKLVDKQTDDASSVTETTKIVDNTKPQWHLRIDGGLGARFVGQTTPLLVLGAGVERRVLGPFFMGLWVKTDLNLLAPSTPPYQVSGGLSLGLEL